MKKIVIAFIRDEAGLTMVEYAVAGALIIVAAVAGFTPLGQAILAQINALAALI
jgi:pilus assembly protein Flp/PilA